MSLAVISAACGAAAAILAKRLLGRTESWLLLGPNFLIIAVLMTPAAPFAFRFSASAGHIGLLGAVIAIDLLANLALFAAIRTGSLGWVLPAASLVPAFALLAAVPLFPSQVQFPVVAAALIVITSVFFLQATDPLPGGEADTSPPPGQRSPKGARVALAYALASAALFGISSNLAKLLLQGHQAATNPFSLYFLRAWGIGITAALVVGSRVGFRFGLPLGSVTIRAVFVIGQWLLFLTALQKGNIVAVSAAANTIPVFSLAGAWFFLGERLTRRRVLAALGATGGVGLLLALTGP
jgi:drug/metabolite transporter (DMT)-like permease